MCNLEWVTIEDVELLWAQFVLQAYDAAIALRIDSMRDNIQFASETLDLSLIHIYVQGASSRRLIELTILIV